MGDKQKSAKISQEQKAVLQAFAGSLTAHNTGRHLSLPELVSGGILSLGKDCVNKPDDPTVIFYVLDEDESVKTALLNRLPDEIKERDIPVLDGVPMELVDQVQSIFGEDWIVSSGKLKGHLFSYKGDEGKQKLIFSRAVDYAIQSYFHEIPNSKDSLKEFDLENKGEYLKVGDVLKFNICKTTKSFITEDGRKGYYFTTYELIINIKTRKKKTRPSGKGRSIPEMEREIPFEFDKPIDFDRDDDFER